MQSPFCSGEAALERAVVWAGYPLAAARPRANMKPLSPVGSVLGQSASLTILIQGAGVAADDHHPNALHRLKGEVRETAPIDNVADSIRPSHAVGK